MTKKLETEIAQLKQQQAVMAEQMKWMALLLRQVGVEGPWVSPQMAWAATGRSRDRVLDDLMTAEEWRISGRRWHLVYGKHYRNDQNVNSTQATWKVHLLRYAEFLEIPPEQLKVAY